MNPPILAHPSREAFAAALLDFINVELPHLSAKPVAHPNVTTDTQLFATGVIDSMAILHLIAFVERGTGETIPPEKVVMRHFQSVTAIAESFWPASS
jgi:acyl carrier protein